MSVIGRSVRLLEAAPDNDVQEIAAILGEARDAYTTTDITIPASEQVNMLYAREYAADRGHDGLGEQAEELLEAKNERTLQKRFVQGVGGTFGLAAADLTYTDAVKEGVTTFFAENGPEYVAEVSTTMPSVAAGLPLVAAGGYVAGEAFYRYHADGMIPLDVDHRHWFIEPIEALREDLLTTYDIDTYCKNTVVPKRYD